MNVLVLGADGYLGWPTAMRFAARGDRVLAIDNYLRRTIALQTGSEALVHNPDLASRARVFRDVAGHDIEVAIGDIADFAFLERAVAEFKPDVAIHYAEQPSAPYSMIGYDEARTTLDNNLHTTLNLVWAVLRHAPDCHIVKLGTMGEYGTPNIDIEEGWIEIDHAGRRDRFLFPRQAGSLYHTTKIFDTDLLWFYVRMFGLRVTDLMQGPVYGLSTAEANLDERLMPNFHYDDIFGTVVNRFLAQAVRGLPLTVYGKGDQARGYLNIEDTLQCVELAARHPAGRGELRIFNQFTEVLTVNEIANRVIEAAADLGLAVRAERITNPRIEKEAHYYNPKHQALLDLGLSPHYLTREVARDLLTRIRPYADRIDPGRVLPRVTWASGVAKKA